MAICPHCQQDKIGFLAGHLKWRLAAPIKCPGCGGISYRDYRRVKSPRWISWGGLLEVFVTILVVEILVWVWLISMLFVRSWWAVAWYPTVLACVIALDAVMTSRRPLLLTPRPFSFFRGGRAI